jgi:hypothetical protein
MDQFQLLRFTHLVGLTLISAGLIGVFVTRATDLAHKRLHGASPKLYGLSGSICPPCAR